MPCSSTVTCCTEGPQSAETIFNQHPLRWGGSQHASRGSPAKRTETLMSGFHPPLLSSLALASPKATFAAGQKNGAWMPSPKKCCHIGPPHAQDIEEETSTPHKTQGSAACNRSHGEPWPVAGTELTLHSMSPPTHPSHALRKWAASTIQPGPQQPRQAQSCNAPNAGSVGPASSEL